MINELKAYCTQNNRVCPNPQQWNELWQMLPELKREGSGWIPSAPLILAAWWHTSDDEKRERLFEHIDYAANHNFLKQSDAYLRALPEDQWTHKGDV